MLQTPRRALPPPSLSLADVRAAKPLPHAFYLRDVATVARELLGKVVLHRAGRTLLAGRIVETEAYEQTEPACHAYQRRTARVEVLYGPPGHAYVYFTYGSHWMLNVVTGPRDFAAAVLVRALEPLTGLTTMRVHRGGVAVRELMRGPGKLARAMAIDARLNGADLTGGTLTVRDAPALGPVRVSTRIGISKAVDLPWRFFVDGPYVSRGRVRLVP